MFKDTFNFYSVGLALALSHIAIEQARALYYSSRKKPAVLRHLVFVDDDGCWDQLTRQLALLLHDTEFPVKHTQKQLDLVCKEIGSLPLVLDADSYNSGSSLQSMLQDTSGSLILRTQENLVTTAVARCAYVIPYKPDDTAIYESDAAKILELRRGLLKFVGMAIRAIEADPSNRLSRNPTLNAYRLVCKALGVEPSRLAEDMCLTTYVGPKNGIIAWLSQLGRKLRCNPTSVGTVVSSDDPDLNDSADIVVTSSYTAIKYSLLDSSATAEMLEHDAIRLGLGLGISEKPKHMRHCILIKKEAWNRYVSTPSRFGVKPSLIEGANSAACG